MADSPACQGRAPSTGWTGALSPGGLGVCVIAEALQISQGSVGHGWSRPLRKNKVILHFFSASEMTGIIYETPLLMPSGSSFNLSVHEERNGSIWGQDCPDGRSRYVPAAHPESIS